MNSQNLMEAMSDISDKYIEEAFAARSGGNIIAMRKARRKRTARIGGIAAAASIVAIALGISLPLITNNTGDNFNSGSTSGSSPSDPGNGDGSGSAPGTSLPPSQAPMYGLGAVIENQNGSIKFVSLTENTAVFEYTWTADIEHEIGYIVTFCQKAEPDQDPVYSVSTSDNFQFGGELLPIELLKITINGKVWSQNKLPDTVGHYVIEFDYSAVLAKYDDIYAETIMLITPIEDNGVWFILGFDLTDDGVIFG